MFKQKIKLITAVVFNKCTYQLLFHKQVWKFIGAKFKNRLNKKSKNTFSWQ